MAQRQSNPAVAGVLPVLKTPGPTSHDVVAIARRALHERGIGHTGTLDPAAGGVLVLCIGPYTKLVPYLTDCAKTYRGEIALGVESSTDDSEGDVVSFADASALTLEQVRAAASKYTGEIQQVPPRYAAVKVDGRKLYEYARKGIEVKVEPRSVTVHHLNIESLDDMKAAPDLLSRGADASHASRMKVFRFTVRVSAGTYVRSIARDLGRDLGCGGYLLSLWRSEVGHFSDDRAIPLEVLREQPEAAQDYVVRGAASVDPERYPQLVLLTSYKERLFRGQPVHDRMLDDAAAAANLRSGAVCSLSDEDGVLLAMVQAERFEAQRQMNVYDSRFNLHLKPLKVFPGGLK